MNGTQEQLSSCERAAAARTRTEPILVAVVFYRPDTGSYGWTLSLIPEGAEVISRWRHGRQEQNW